MPKVSIVVPVYNMQKYLAACIKSLKAQTLSDIEIILGAVTIRPHCVMPMRRKIR